MYFLYAEFQKIGAGTEKVLKREVGIYPTVGFSAGRFVFAIDANVMKTIKIPLTAEYYYPSFIGVHAGGFVNW
jgi:hypothetical protein